MTGPLVFPAAGCCWCCVAAVERGDLDGHPCANHSQEAQP